VLEFDTYIRFLLALGFVLALIGIGTWLIKRFALERGVPQARRAAKRLQVVETLSIDTRRKLVLVRRDATEHLLLFGPNQELLVENGIGQAVAPALDQRSGPAERGEGARLVPIPADRGPIRDRR
jgi:flagellar protein FliO/FliZ